MTNAIEHAYMSLKAICTFIPEMSFQVHCPFLIELFGYLLSIYAINMFWIQVGFFLFFWFYFEFLMCAVGRPGWVTSLCFHMTKFYWNIRILILNQDSPRRTGMVAHPLGTVKFVICLLFMFKALHITF